jgi:putative hydrolase of the HAD superfamily
VLKAIFFDAAGTLFEPREPAGRSYARIARQFGVDAPDDLIVARFRDAFAASGGLAFGPGHSPAELRRLERGWWRELVARVFAGSGGFRDFDAFFAALFAYFGEPSSWVADREAAAALERLKNEGLRVGVISNFDYRLYHLLEGLGLTPWFDSITISSEAGYAKPRREVFAAALAKHAIAPRDAMHVGDSEDLDFEAARAAGLAAVLIDRSAQAAPRMSRRSARINSLASVPQLTQRLQFA